MVAFPLYEPPNFRFRTVAQLSYASVLTAGLLFATGSALASTVPASPAAVPAAAAGLASKINATPLIERWAPYIKEASQKFGIAEDWIKAVMRVESGGRTVADD